MSNVKTMTTKEKEAGYEKFISLVKEEYPNPVYCYEDEEEYAERFVKENPKASIHHGVFYKTAVCMDDKSSLMLSYETLSFMNNFIYLSDVINFGKAFVDCETILRMYEGGD